MNNKYKKGADVREELYPPIEPNYSGYMELDSLHQMYWEESGNPEGIPVVVVHGGPGGGTSPSMRQFFDPNHYHIILFDQRGAGRSKPHAELEANTTSHLIEDMEKLRNFLNIHQWYIFGGSWGATLGLAYAEEHPDRCLGLILRGVFLCRESEFKWLLEEARAIFPEEHDRFLSHLHPEETKNWQTILKAYYQRVTDPKPEIRLSATKAWSRYEGALATLYPNPTLVSAFEIDAFALALARIETHYFINDIFLPENDILNKVHRIRHIPGVIVQGRYDIVCPIISAYDLKCCWPEVDYRVIPDGGHSSSEPGIQKELVKIMEEFKTKDAQRERNNAR